MNSNYKFKSFTFFDESKDFLWREFDSVVLKHFSEYILGFILSDKFEIAKKVIDQSEPLTSSGKINATSTTSEADVFHHIINESSGFKLINTGTIDSYKTLWGRNEIVDKGKKYLKPFLPKEIKLLGENRFNLYSNPKIIFAKIAISTEAFFDESGEYASINTNCIHSFNDAYHPYYILAWVNSKLFQYIFECFFDGLKMAGGYLLYSSPNLSNTYIKKAEYIDQKTISDCVGQLLSAIETNSIEVVNLIKRKLDIMFFTLYGLTEEEIQIIEKSLQK